MGHLQHCLLPPYLTSTNLEACSEHRLLRTAYHFFYHVVVWVFLTNLVRVQFYKLSFLFQLIIFCVTLYIIPLWYVWIFSFTIKLLLVAVVSLKLPLLLFFLVRSFAKINVTSWNPNHMFYTFSPFFFLRSKIISYDQQKVLKMSTINGKGKQNVCFHYSTVRAHLVLRNQLKIRTSRFLITLLVFNWSGLVVYKTK